MAAFVVVYVVIALCNYSIVQSYLGALASHHFTQEWGGKVKIASLHANPLGYVRLRGIELISPTEDTIFAGEAINCQFKHFPPIDGEGVNFSQVRIKNAYYHLKIDSTGINLKYIFEHYAKKETTKDTTPSKPFVVRVKRLLLNNVHYKQDLKKQSSYYADAPGVNVSHMDFLKVDANIKDIRVEKSNVDCRIVKFYAQEHSGFTLQDLSADVKVSPYMISAQNMELTTDHSHMFFDALLQYHGWKMDPYCDSVVHTITFKPGTIIGIRDGGYWAKTLWGMDEKIALSGHFTGPVADMRADSVSIAFGEESFIAFDGTIKGLPHIKNTLFDIDIERLHTTDNDLLAVKHPEGIEVKVPELLHQLKVIDLAAKLDGGWEGATVSLEMASAVGNVVAGMEMKNNNDVFEYKGDVRSDGLHIASLKENEWVTKSGLALDFEGRGQRFDELSGTLHGQLNNTVLRGTNIRNTTIDAQLDKKVITAKIDLKDTLAKIDLDARVRLDKECPSYDAELKIADCDLSKLANFHLTKEDTVKLETKMAVHLKGNSIDSIVGTIDLKDTKLVTHSTPTTLERLALSIERENRHKTIHLNSDFCTLSMDGYFDYADLPQIVNHFKIRYVPQYYCGDMETPVTETLTALCQFDLDMHWNDKKQLLSQLVPQITLAPHTHLHSSYNSTEGLKWVLRSDSIGYNKFRLHDIGMNGGSMDSSYSVALNADHLSVGEMDLFDNFRVNMFLHSKKSKCRLSWEDLQVKANQIADGMDLRLSLLSDKTGNKLAVEPSSMTASGEVWTIDCDTILFDRVRLQVPRIDLHSGSQRIYGKGQLRKEEGLSNESSQMMLTFDNFDIGRLDSLLLQGSKVSVTGLLDGDISITARGNAPLVVADLVLDSCHLNDQPIGKVNLKSDFDAESQHINIDAHSMITEGGNAPFAAKGHIAIGTTPYPIHVDVDFNRFALKTITPLIASITSDVEGTISSHIELRGDVGSPQLSGTARFEDGRLHLDYNNVDYTFDDSIRLNGKEIAIEDFHIKDPNGNALVANGTIGYRNLDNLQIDINVNSRNIMLLNSRSNGDNLYGTIFASINGFVKGSPNDIAIELQARTNSGSELTIPINNKRQASESDYIHFTQREQAIASKRESESSSKAPSSDNRYRLQLDLNVTPDVTLHLPMTFSQLNAKVNATGSGNLQLQASTNHAPELVGTYELTRGNMRFNLFSLFEKNFTIDPGSALLFPGDISSMQYDIRAIYSQRVNIASLTGMSGSSETNQRTIQVEDVIALSGTLYDPTIGFDIRLPNAESSVSEEVFTYIDKSNPQDMLNQTMSLLLLGQFYNANTANQDNQLLSNAAAGGYNLMASSVSSVVSNMIQVVDVNFGYKAATDLTTEQFDVNISKEWDRFYFETTLGYGGETRNLQENEQENQLSNLVGDALIGYKLNPRLHLFVFNRTNTNDYTRTEMPYKQGIGVKYTRDFNRWGELFRKSKRTPQTKSQK